MCTSMCVLEDLPSSCKQHKKTLSAIHSILLSLTRSYSLATLTRQDLSGPTIFKQRIRKKGGCRERCASSHAEAYTTINVPQKSPYQTLGNQNNSWVCFINFPYIIFQDGRTYVTGSEKRYTIAHIFKIELLAPRGRVSSQL